MHCTAKELELGGGWRTQYDAADRFNRDSWGHTGFNTHSTYQQEADWAVCVELSSNAKESPLYAVGSSLSNQSV